MSRSPAWSFLLATATAVVPCVAWLVPWAWSASADPHAPLTRPDLMAAAIPPLLALWLPLSFLVVRRLFTAAAEQPPETRPPGGVCRSCGYDLRATPHRCPECGTVPPGKAAP